MRHVTSSLIWGRSREMTLLAHLKGRFIFIIAKAKTDAREYEAPGDTDTKLIRINYVGKDPRHAKIDSSRPCEVRSQMGETLP